MNKCKQISILSWNIKGIKGTIDGCLINKLHVEKVSSSLIEHDIVLIEETHLTKEEEQSLFLAGFGRPINFIRPKRKKAGSSSGGIALFIKDSIRPNVKILPKSNHNIVWIQIMTDTGHNDVFLACVYLPPEHSSFGKDNTVQMWEDLENDIDDLSAKGSIVLCGDFNARSGEYKDYIEHDNINNIYTLPPDYSSDDIFSRRSMDKVIHKFGRRLVDLCNNFNIHILNGRILGDIQGKFTCYQPQGCSVVDYFICSHDLLKDVISMRVKNLQVYSDHCPLEMKIRLPLINKDNTYKRMRYQHNQNISYNINEKLSIKETYQWDSSSYEKLMQALSAPDMNRQLQDLELEIEQTRVISKTSYTESNVDNITDKFTDILNNAANNSLKKQIKMKINIRKKKRNKVWFTKNCYQQRKELKSILNALNRYPFNSSLCQKYYSVRKRYNSLIKKQKREYRNKLVLILNDQFNNDPNKLWKTLKDLKSMGDNDRNNNKCNINPTKWLNHLANLIGTKPDISEQRSKEVSEELKQSTHQYNIPTLDNPITGKEIKIESKSLKNKKAPGPDKLSNEIIKASLDRTVHILTKLFNLILITGHYPKNWKSSISIPIYKKGDPLNPSNYRGITLSSNLSKLFCKVMNSRISKFLEDDNIIRKEQAGFRKGYRTTDQIFVLKKIVDDLLKLKNGRMYACFVDFQKAFDNVWHEALLLKLYTLGIRGYCFNIIKDMYTNSFIRTEYNQECPMSIHVRKGVHQGNTLSPILFNIFINDFTTNIPDFDSPYIDINSKTKISCLMYADDLVMLSKSKLGLQQKLDYLNIYCQQWGLKINTEKTNIVIFCRSLPKINTIFKCGDCIIKRTDQYKYLGIVFNQNGNLNIAQEHLSKQGNKAAYSLRKAFRNSLVQTKTILNLFDLLVSPIICYGAEVWFPYIIKNTHIFDDIDAFFQCCISKECPHESAHIRFCRFILGTHKKSMKIPVLAELGRFPIGLRILSQCIKYWAHILETKKDSYIYQAYLSLLDPSRESSWSHFIKQAVDKLGFNHVWQNQSTFNSKKLQKAIQEKLECKFIKFWINKKSEGSSKLKFYAKVTDSRKYELQSYINEVKNLDHRKALTKLRISAHDLEIEKGRHLNTPVNDRLCKKCNVIEDEIHLLDKCTKYTSIREKFISSIAYSGQYTLPSQILQIPKLQTQLAQFVYECFKKR